MAGISVLYILFSVAVNWKALLRKCKLNESLLCHADQLNLSHSVFVCAETGNLCCKQSNLCQNVLAGFQCVQVYSRRRVLYCQVCSVQFVKVVYSVSFTFDSFLVDFFFLSQVLY